MTDTDPKLRFTHVPDWILQMMSTADMQMAHRVAEFRADLHAKSGPMRMMISTPSRLSPNIFQELLTAALGPWSCIECKQERVGSCCVSCNPPWYKSPVRTDAIRWSPNTERTLKELDSR